MRPEDCLQAAHVKWLRACLPECSLVLAIKNEHKADDIAGSFYKVLGCVTGTSDLLLVIPRARPVFIELKVWPNKVRAGDAQDLFLSAARCAGAVAFESHSIEETREKLHANGIPCNSTLERARYLDLMVTERQEDGRTARKLRHNKPRANRAPPTVRAVERIRSKVPF